MPTYERLPKFQRDFRRLTLQQRQTILAMVRVFIAGLRASRFDPRLRVKRVHGYEGVWEVTGAPDGRATFAYGTEITPGEPHII